MGEVTWSDIAGWYDQLLRAGSGPHETAVECVLELLPPLEGAVVLDVACGQGLATRAVAAAGAAMVIGTDASETMVRLARRHGAPSGCDVSYVVDDARRLGAFGSASFDGATCQLALMDIPGLDATLAAIGRVLRDDAWFVFVIGHPCFLAPDATVTERPDGRAAVTVTGYFDERFWRSSNPNGVRRAGNYHRTLATYLNALVRNGFRLEEVAEPRPGPLLARQQPLYTEVPIFFAGRARRDCRREVAPPAGDMGRSLSRSTDRDGCDQRPRTMC
jgi:SAM-dependent methyltransferase